MKNIKHVDTLVYYDGVQVFVGQDSAGGRYLGVMTSRFDQVDQYLVTKVKQERLDQFCSGAIDLRSLLLASASDGWYLTRTGADFDQPLALEQQKGNLAKSDFLPAEGFLLSETIQADD